MPLLEVTRPQILAFRRRTGSLDERLPMSAKSLRRAAWAGLQDSMPRAAVISIHARVHRATPGIWEHSTFVQLWGPRYHDYVIAAQDVAIFSLGRLPAQIKTRDRAFTTAQRLHDYLEDRRMPHDEAERAIGLGNNRLRYAALTGRVLLRWDGSRQPIVWTAPPPAVDPSHARLNLARRFLHIFGPTTSTSFHQWAGIPRIEAEAAFQTLAAELIAVRTPIGEAFLLATDEASLRAKPTPPAPARLLPSGDAFFLAWGADRAILVPGPKQQSQLWTSRVWPGALLVNGEITGTWRRSAAVVSIDPWRALSSTEREAVEAEAALLPLPGHKGRITVLWSR